MTKFLFFIFLLISFFSLATEEERKALLKKVKSAVTEQQKIITSIELTEFYESYDYQKWQEEIRQLKDKFRNVKNKKVKNKIALSLAKNALSTGNQDEFIKYFKSLDFENLAFDRGTLTDFNFLKIKSFLIDTNYLEAKELAIQNLVIARQTRKNRFVSESYATLAEIYALQNNMDSAYICASYCTSFGKRSDTKQSLFKALHLQATIFAYFENYEAAVNKELQVLQLAEGDNNLYYQVLSFQGVAIYSLEIKNLDEALIYLTRSNDLNLKLKDKRINAINSLIEAGIYVNKGQFKEALKTVNTIESYFKLNRNLNSLGNCELLKGIIELKMKRFQKSLAAFESATFYFNRSGNQANLNLVIQFVGEVYLLKKELNKAENYLKIAAIENEKRGLKSVKTQSIYKLLSQLYFEKNQLQKAVKYQFLYLEFLEKNTILNSAATVARMTEGNLREERERLIEFQKESIEKQKKEKEIKSLQLSRQLFIAIIIIGLVIVGFIFYILRLRQEKLKQKQREMELSQSLLRTQMNPHFIFNAMSVIQSYIYSNEPDKSSQFLVNFSRLIRLILENSPKEFIPIELETEILEKYLQAQKMRFENRFSYSLEIDESLIAASAMVPPMITQPFVENSIEHGQLHTIENGHITIRISQVDTMIQIQISDNGVGRKGAQKTKKIKSHKSMAINITKERIEIINFKYKKQGSIQMEDLNKKKQTGTVVTILLPLHIDTD
jgi:tetratricopeptide (TPR) repeat protein